MGERVEYDVDIKLRFSVDSDVTDNEIESMMDWVFTNWNDGRYPFNVEMVHSGARSIVEVAVGRAIETRMRAKYGREMVPQKGGASTSRWHLEAEKVKTKIKVWPSFSREETVSVAKVEDEGKA